MVLNKKGISPLIATVLIIGFTVALAAVIMVWGQGFIKGMTEKAEATSTLETICATDVAVDVTNACITGTTGGTVTLTIANNGARALEGLAVRAYRSASDLESVAVLETDLPLAAAGADTFTVYLTGEASTVRQVEVVPTIEVEGKEHTCATALAKFPVGSLPDTALDACPP